MFCKKCGTEIKDENNGICPNCKHMSVMAIVETGEPVKYLPSFILGIIGTVFGICGGLCMTMCSSFYSSGTAAFVFIFGGSIVGLIGACQCLKNAKKGAILELVAAIMIIICAYGITGGDISTVLAMLMFLIGGILGISYSVFVNKK